MIQLLDFDSQICGFPVAKFVKHRLTEATAKNLIKICRQKKVRCLYAELDADHYDSLASAARYGFNLSDIKVRFERKGSSELNFPLIKGVVIDDVLHASDHAQLIKLNENLALTSRFAFDPNFLRSQVKAIYKQWMINSLNGTVASKIYVARLRSNHRIMGFITCKIGERLKGEIPLIVVDQKYRYKNIGSLLLQNALNYFKNKGIMDVEVVTQGRNVAAQRFYVRNGFLLKQTSIFFHLWFNQIKR